MKLISTTADKKPTPLSPLPIDCITYKFDTGHSMTKYMDGTVFYKNRVGKTLNRLIGTAVIKEMERLISEGKE